MRRTPHFELIASRKAAELAIVGRDKGAPVMAEQRDLAIPAPHGALAARLYRSQVAPAGGGGLLFFHGGGFVHGGLESHDAFCRRLAETSGLRIVAVDYRLAPEHAFPAQVEDGETAALWLLAHLADFGIAPDRLLIGGDSAGGYIAATVAARLNHAEPGPFAGQVLIYPLLQVDDAEWASSRFEDARMLGRLAVNYIRAGLQAGEAGIPSLLHGDYAGAPRTLIVTGGPLDPCRPDALRYAEALSAAGVEVRLMGYPTLVHGFINLTHAIKRAQTAVGEIGQATAELLEPDLSAATGEV